MDRGSTEHGELQISSEVERELFAAAQAAYPQEACGLLLGSGGRITAVQRTRNVDPSPLTRFEIDPQALIDAYRGARGGGARGGGAQIIGYFHSHPTGDARPSATDRAMAARDGKVWAIVAGEDVTFWRDDPGGFTVLSYAVIDR